MNQSQAIAQRLNDGTVASKVLLVIWTIVTGTILLLELWGLWETHQNGGFRKLTKTTKQFRLLMLGQNTIVFCLAVAGCVSYYTPFLYTQSQCDAYSMALSDLYAIATMLFWIFLLKKVELVSKYENHRLYQVLYAVTWVLAYLYWPLVKIPLNAVYYTGFMLPNGICVPGKSSAAFILQLMIACNIAMVLFSTLLFCYPLIVSANKVNKDGKPIVMKTIRKTIFLSTVGTMATTVALVNMQIAISTADPLVIYLFMPLSLGYHVTSLTIDSICAHLMTSAWMPQMLRKHVATEAQENTAELTSSPTGKSGTNNIFSRLRGKTGQGSSSHGVVMPVDDKLVASQELTVDEAA
jgi:hypothetical protein